MQCVICRSRWCAGELFQGPLYWGLGHVWNASLKWYHTSRSNLLKHRKRENGTIYVIYKQWLNDWAHISQYIFCVFVVIFMFSRYILLDSSNFWFCFMTECIAASGIASKRSETDFSCALKKYNVMEIYVQNICNVTYQIHLENLFQNNTPKVRSKASHILISWSLMQISKQPHEYSARRGCNIWFVILCSLTQLSTFLLSDSGDLLSFVPLVWVYCACCFFYHSGYLKTENMTNTIIFIYNHQMCSHFSMSRLWKKS